MLFEKEGLRKSAEIKKPSPIRQRHKEDALGDIRLSSKTREGGRVIVTRDRFTNPKSVDIQNPEILAFLK